MDAKTEIVQQLSDEAIVHLYRFGWRSGFSSGVVVGMLGVGLGVWRHDRRMRKTLMESFSKNR